MQLNPLKSPKSVRALLKGRKVIKNGERQARGGAEGLQSKVGEGAEGAKKAGQTLKNKASGSTEKLKEGVQKFKGAGEASAILDAEVQAALRRMKEEDSRLEEELDQAHGYAVFPAVGSAAAVLGVSYGRGEVFEEGKLIGYSGIVQLTVGTQLGGQAFDQIVVFDDQDALEQFKAGKTSFAAGAGSALVKAGALTSRAPPPTRAFYYSSGGFMLTACIGGQKYIFRPATLT